MILHVDPIEVLWLVVNMFTLGLTGLALAEARSDLKVARTDSPELRHRAREITAFGNVRREILRLVVQVLLLTLVIPGLFSEAPITLSPFVIALILIAVVLMTSTLFDARDRSKLAIMLLELVHTEKNLLALESSVQENIKLTKEVGNKADHAGEQATAAYHEANSVNKKIAKVGKRVLVLEDKEVADDARKGH